MNKICLFAALLVKLKSSQRCSMSFVHQACFVLLMFSLNIDSVFAQWSVINRPSDVCEPEVIVVDDSDYVQSSIQIPGGNMRVYRDNGVRIPRGKPIALLVNGNGYRLDDYHYFARFLVRKGFLVAVTHRQFGSDYVPNTFVMSALDTLYDEFSLDVDSPVALIGHSVGADVAIRGAVTNYEDNFNYNIKSLIAIAPRIFTNSMDDTPQLNGLHIKNYFLMYGSQDQDVAGLGGDPEEAFAAYDLSGTNYSSTGHTDAPGNPSPQTVFEKTMLFVHGADHPGFIGLSQPRGVVGQFAPINEFLSTQDQFCIGKSYTNAVLEWTLNDNLMYKSMAKGDYRPASIANMSSDSIDGLGNSVGSALRMSVQHSAARRSIVENFEGSSWDMGSVSDDVVYDPIDEGDFVNAAQNVRHLTNSLAIGWPQKNNWQWLEIRIRPAKQDVRLFSHLTLRVGQLFGSSGNYGNALNNDKEIYVGLHDGAKIRIVSSDDWGGIPRNDIRPNDETYSVMNTLKIPLSRYSELDRSNIISVFLIFPDNTKGTILLDDLQWIKN